MRYCDFTYFAVRRWSLKICRESGERAFRTHTQWQLIPKFIVRVAISHETITGCLARCKLPSKVYPLLCPPRKRDRARDPLSVPHPRFLSLRAGHVFSLKLHPPQKYHCSNIQNGDVHCGTLEWAQCGSCVAARACCDLQLVRDFF